MNEDGQLVIIGAGPAGIAAAITAVREGFPAQRIVLIEKGARHDDSRVSGFGGAGANSDGKLVLESEIGGELADHVRTDMPALLDEVLELYLGFLSAEERAPYDAMRGRFLERAAVERIQRACIRAGLQYLPADIVPLGTETCHRIVDRWFDFLTERGARILLDTRATGFRARDEGWRVSCEDGTELTARWLLAAPGRSGHQFLVTALQEIDLDTVHGPIDIGVRVETDARLTAPLTDATWEFKLRGLIEGERVRTFCVCPEGSVLVERYDGDVLAVNGQTWTRPPDAPTSRCCTPSTWTTRAIAPTSWPSSTSAPRTSWARVTPSCRPGPSSSSAGVRGTATWATPSSPPRLPMPSPATSAWRSTPSPAG